MVDTSSLGQVVVEEVTVFPVALPRTVELVGSNTSRTTYRQAAYVRIRTKDGQEGWGECCSLETPGYTTDAVNESARVLTEWMAPIVLSAGPIYAHDVFPLLDKSVKGAKMAKAALEAAVLDAVLRKQGLSLKRFLGGSRDEVAAGAAVGFPALGGDDSGLEAVVSEVKSRFAEGYKRVRVKVSSRLAGHEWLLRPLQAIRQAGVDGLIIPDGNEGFSTRDLDALTRLGEVGVPIIEQPFGERRFSDHRRLRMAAPDLTVVADESIGSLDELELALDATGGVAAFNGVCNKWSRVGGILNAYEVIRRCNQLDVSVGMGAMIGLGMQTDTILASTIQNDRLIGDHGPSDKWVDSAADPTPFVAWSRPGYIPVSTAPGVVPIDESRVLANLWAPARRVSLVDGVATVEETVQPVRPAPDCGPAPARGFNLWPN